MNAIHFTKVIFNAHHNKYYFLAWNLRFGEGDFSEREGDGNLEAVVIGGGDFIGNVTVQVIPMTVSQFQNQGLTPFPDTLDLNSPNLGQAQAGIDL